MKIKPEDIDRMMGDEEPPQKTVKVIRRLRRYQEELQFRKPDTSKLRDLKRGIEDKK
jgi:hypothetical protein